MLKFRAVVFDWSGVIAGINGDTFRQQVAAFLHVDLAQYRQVYYKYNRLLNDETLPLDEFLRVVLRELRLPEELWHELHKMEGWHAANAKTNPEVWSIVMQLRQRGYKLGLLSNNSRAGAKTLHTRPEAQAFDVFHVSAVTGHPKPYPEAYTAMSAALGIPAQATFFVDDVPHNVDAAKQAGMQAVVYQNASKLRQDLRHFGLL